MKSAKKILLLGCIGAMALLLLAGCGGNSRSENGAQEGRLSGSVVIDGSSTVFPATEAVAEEFQKEHKGVRVTVGVSGTGGGFKKFAIGETDISNASRPIKESEADVAKEHNIEFIELPVAFDGLSVMVNPQNDWVDYLTVSELHEIWKPGSTITKWNQIRPEWPDKEIILYGPGTDSGTFDYFTEAINGKSQASRSDYTSSEDDNLLVKGIAGDLYSLGYFGYAYYIENTDKLKLVAIDGGNGPVLPDEKTINDGSYTPLSRPIYIYVNKESLKRPEVREFAKYYMVHGADLVSQVGYIKLTDDMYQEGLAKIEAVQ